MQGTVVMLLALSGLGCHHKKCAPVAVESCYSSCYSSGCYSSSYAGSSCYSSCYSSGYSGSSCYSSGYSSCYSSVTETSCYSSCYSAPKHKHGLFGCKKKSCAACCAPAPVAMPSPCDPCTTGYAGPPVYGTYTPVYSGQASGQMMGSMQMSTPPPTTVTDKPTDMVPGAPDAPSPGTPAPKPDVPPAAEATPPPPTPKPGS